ncbi:MAG: TusE/DsrC/DsvC family sulfur relay protein [Cytophagales bacterium]|jgi:tRNA 2-thiouridine synthesizing protein E|nr:TusE/DsrC/DsvC family sulfur relay protein [Cytophagales bacterium]MCA6366025.1 TusE/DsrC/DsvC family sulfur relay protein [Cytophagales bacterium]MCA6373814.1 TusE/DsrC/DsvC family sulfur relay protein [Cytophagales bacterium]MCA6376010.1 TusE/DsrC/DsvC family sulfur relay protein [Cytophagales bacterium]MCA6383445.1 TusE/DsrC/DsvC family sulfur relay protein [Cytophagales bacterium]
METLVMNNGMVDVNEDGYLKNPAQWTPELAHGIAKEVNIELTDRHFEVLNWLRAKQAEGVALSIRKVGNSGLVDIKEFYQLFPGGPLKISSKIAGIPKPVSCI